MSVLAIRMGAFAAFFVGLFVLERAWPQRLTRREGFASNIGLFLVDSVLTRLLVVVGGAAAALWAAREGVGVFNVVDAPAWLVGVVCFLVLDFAVWAQHVVMHRVPVLWRLHEVHHADPDFDLTTGLRFHPVEIALSLAYKSAIVVALGAPIWTVVLFEVVLNSGAMFSHSNLRLPRRVDQVLRRFVVTPDMHRVHHSVHHREANSNYGFFLPWWDRLFRTYRAQPVDGHRDMVIGVRAFTDRRLRTLLVRPFAPRARSTPAR